MAVAQHLPQGRSQAGDRHLNFHETRDNLWLPPDFESLQSAPALQEIVARHFDNARQWATDRKQEHIELMIGTPDPRPFHRGRRGGRGLEETRLVADLEQNLGRRA